MKPYWKPQHEVFIRAMLKHEDPTKAYRIAYPKAKPASARVGGSRLSGYPHIRQRLEPVLKERRVKAHQQALTDGAAREQREYERRMEMRRTLYKVVMKKLRRQRVFIIKGRSITIEEDPSTNTILNAMVLDIRLEAGYNNWPVIERRFARIMASLLPRKKREQSVTNSVSVGPLAIVCSKIDGSPLGDRGNKPHVIGDIAALQEISLSGRNDAMIFSVQSVTKARVKPAQTHIAAHTKANVQPAVVTKAEYSKVYPPI